MKIVAPFFFAQKFSNRISNLSVENECIWICLCSKAGGASSQANMFMPSVPMRSCLSAVRCVSGFPSPNCALVAFPPKFPYKASVCHADGQAATAPTASPSLAQVPDTSSHASFLAETCCGGSFLSSVLHLHFSKN